MPRTKILLLLLVVGLTTTLQAQAPPSAPKPEPKAETWSDPSPHKSGFVTVNGVQLNYLDWGGSGPTLILIHGLGDNPHLYDYFAPGFTDRFRVIAYARRGEGDSEAKGPYDGVTLADDLRGLMDALGINKAHLVGFSMGGDEITAMSRLSRAIPANHTPPTEPIVQTNLGKIRGAFANGLYSFKGIHYGVRTKQLEEKLVHIQENRIRF